DHSIRCINYQANQSLVSSDHKPVYALFEVILDSGGPRIPFRLKKLSQTVDGLKSKALSRENSLEFSSGTSNSVSRNITFFGRKLGRKSRAKPKENRNGLLSISMSSLPSVSSLSKLDK